MRKINLTFKLPVIILAVLITVLAATNAFAFMALAFQQLIFPKIIIFIMGVLLIYIIWQSFYHTSFASLWSNFKILLATLCFLFLLYRLPFYVQPMVGEDSIFAEIMVSHPVMPNYCYSYQRGGLKVFSLIAHPAFNYELISKAGYLFASLISFEDINDLELASRLRWSFSLFMGIFFLSFTCLIGYWYRNRPFPFSLAVVLLLFVISPIALVTSTEMQIDNSAGILFTSILFFGIIFFNATNFKIYTKVAVLFLCFLVMGFGKHEWSIVVLLACLVLPIADWIRGSLFKVNIDYQKVWLLTAFGSLGLIAGNIISYLYDAENYYLGMELFVNMVNKFSLLSTTNLAVPTIKTIYFDNMMAIESQSWLNITLGRLEYIYVLLIGLLFVVYLIIKNIKYLNSTLTLMVLIMAALFFSFFISTWGGFVRYFCPSMVGIIICICMCTHQFGIHQVNKYFSYFVICTSIFMSLRLYSLKINLTHKNEIAYFETHKNQDKNMMLDCVNLVNVSLNKPLRYNCILKCNANPTELEYCNAD